MTPSFREGQIIIASRIGAPKAGDIVIIVHKSLEKIKRIHDIDDDRIYVLGDNNIQSTDSRQFGWINRETVIARVIWPRSRTHL